MQAGPEGGFGILFVHREGFNGRIFGARQNGVRWSTVGSDDNPAEKRASAASIVKAERFPRTDTAADSRAAATGVTGIFECYAA
jgi:hypothetical protein